MVTDCAGVQVWWFVLLRWWWCWWQRHRGLMMRMVWWWVLGGAGALLVVMWLAGMYKFYYGYWCCGVEGMTVVRDLQYSVLAMPVSLFARGVTIFSRHCKAFLYQRTNWC